MTKTDPRVKWLDLMFPLACFLFSRLQLLKALSKLFFLRVVSIFQINKTFLAIKAKSAHTPLASVG
jgi:hypothetical protein